MGKCLALAALVVVCGCGKDENQSGFERLADIVPLKVVVTDFAIHQDGGTKVIYRIKGSALVTVPIGLASFMESATDPNTINVENLPCPRVDPRSVRFEDGGTELLDCNRDAFTSIAKTGKIHNELRKNATKAIADAAGSKEVIDDAKLRTVNVLKSFYTATGRKLGKYVWSENQQ